MKQPYLGILRLIVILVVIALLILGCAELLMWLLSMRWVQIFIFLIALLIIWGILDG